MSKYLTEAIAEKMSSDIRHVAAGFPLPPEPPPERDSSCYDYLPLVVFGLFALLF